jgi:hypothetical protein
MILKTEVSIYYDEKIKTTDLFGRSEKGKGNTKSVSIKYILKHFFLFINQTRRGALCRSMSPNFNVPNINVLHINGSLLQP